MIRWREDPTWSGVQLTWSRNNLSCVWDCNCFLYPEKFKEKQIIYRLEPNVFFLCQNGGYFMFIRTFLRKCSRILTSTRACWWNLGNKETPHVNCCTNVKCTVKIRKEKTKHYSIVCICAHVLVSYLFLLRIILAATCFPVLWSRALTTWPKDPLPRTSNTSYLYTKWSCTAFR